MKHIAALALNLFKGQAALHEAAEQGKVEHLNKLLRLGIYKVNCYSLGLTALYNSILFNQPACLITLLAHQADPNLPCTRLNFTYKKPVELSISNNNVSEIKLLAMHGAKAEEIKFSKKNQAAYDLLVNTITIKQDYDTVLMSADKHYRLGQYKHSLELYQQAGNIWYKLSKQETIAVYKSYYQKKALTDYAMVIASFKHLSIESAPTAKDILKQLTIHITDMRHSLSSISGLADNSQQVARLLVELSPYSKNLAFVQPKNSIESNKNSLSNVLSSEQPQESRSYNI